MNLLSKVVLIVDDSQTVRRMVEWSLKPCGYRILQAADGVEALEILKRESVDLGVIDLNMPRMDGIELVRFMRGDKKLMPLPVIMLTTESREVDLHAALAAGANLVLTKPSTPELLRSKAESLLGTAASAAERPKVQS